MVFARRCRFIASARGIGVSRRSTWMPSSMSRSSRTDTSFCSCRTMSRLASSGSSRRTRRLSSSRRSERLENRSTPTIRRAAIATERSSRLCGYGPLRPQYGAPREAERRQESECHDRCPGDYSIGPTPRCVISARVIATPAERLSAAAASGSKRTCIRQGYVGGEHGGRSVGRGRSSGRAARPLSRHFRQGRRDSNPRPTVLETAALPTELRPSVRSPVYRRLSRGTPRP